MAHHANRLTPDQVKDENPFLSGLSSRLSISGALIGIFCLLIALFVGKSQNDDLQHLLFSYLVAFVFFVSLGLGGLIFTIIQHLTRASWSVVVRRISEIIGGTLPFMAILALPVVVPALMGNFSVFTWLDPAHVAEDHSGMLAHKQPYLSGGFWVLRLAVYFIIWGALATFFHRTSLKQDDSGNAKLTVSMWKVSAPAVLLFALTTTFFAIDMVMTLNPHWFSTIFGVYFFAGSFVGFVSLLVVIVMLLQKSGRLQRAITIEHRHDLGKLIFAFLFFWGYIAFSQYMLIWYANMPEETGWYLDRQSGEWLWVLLALLFGHFIIPFLGLLPRGIKRRKIYLTFWAVWMLIIHWLDIYCLVMPEYSKGTVPFHFLDLLCLLGVGGLFLASAAFLAGGNPLVPVKDPQLAESLRFENV